VKYASYFVRNADGTINYINNTTMNLGGQKAAGVDVSASYAFPKTSYGDFKVSIDGTYLTQFDNQLYDGSPFVSNIGQFGLASNGTTSSFPHHLPLEAHRQAELGQGQLEHAADPELQLEVHRPESGGEAVLARHQLVQAVELHCDLQRLQEHAWWLASPTCSTPNRQQPTAACIALVT
jgi:hypothetical protein